MAIFGLEGLETAGTANFTMTITEAGFRAVRKARYFSLIRIGGILIVLLSIIGCSDRYGGSMLTADDIDRYIVKHDDEAVCLRSDSDSACLKLTPKTSGGTENFNAPIIHIHPNKLIYVFYYEGRQILRAERAVDTREIVKELKSPQQHLDDDQGNDDGGDGNIDGNRDNTADNGNTNGGGPLRSNPPPVNSNPPIINDPVQPPLVNNNPPPVNSNPPSSNEPVQPPPVNNNPPVNSNPPNNNPPPVNSNPPSNNDPVQPPPVNNNPPPLNNNPPVVSPPSGEIDAHHVYDDGWIIWINYPQGTAPTGVPSLAGSGLDITINGKKITDSDISGFAQVEGSDGKGVQFFYPTGVGSASSLVIEVRGLVSAGKTVTFSMNSPVETSPEGVTYQLSPL